MIIVHIAECSHFYFHTYILTVQYFETVIMSDEVTYANAGWTLTTEIHCCPALLLLALASSYFLIWAPVILAE